MLAAVFAVLFGVSLLPGRKPLCLRFAERISGGIMPEGAAEYCRKLTWVWFAVLAFLAEFNIFAAFESLRAARESGDSLPFLSLCLSMAVVPLVFLVEGRVRRRKFSVAFHTSGSTGKSKTIVKTFENLAKEVAFHRDFYKGRIDSAETTFICTIEPGHMYGTLWRVMLPKALGCRVDPDVVMTPESLLSKMRAAKKAFLVTTPSFLSRFTAYASAAEVPRNCVEITTSGALLAPDVAAATEKIFGMAPREIFGSTETGGVASRRQSAEARAKGKVEWEVFAPVRVRSCGGRLQVRSPFSFSRVYTMGDGVELSGDARRFRLLGRMDRMVKINEERVNLAEMEEKVRALGFGSCALAVQSGRRGEYIGCLLECKAGENRTPLELRAALLPVFPKGTVPKKIRVVRSLPRNPQGKVVHAAVVEMLDSALVEPCILRDSLEDGEYRAVFRFDGDAPYFDGHFPSFALLPGVVQLGFAVRFSRLAGSRGEVKLVKKLKFTKIVRPGDEVEFSVRRKSDGEYRFEYRKEGSPCSSGVLVF